MRKILLLLSLTFACCHLSIAQTDITIKFVEGITFDSITVRGYQCDTGYYTVLSQPFSQTLSLKRKQSLSPGIYFIICDGSLTGAFLFSSAKNQTLTIEMNGQDIQIQGNEENVHYKEYLDQMQEFEFQMTSLQREFHEAQRSMPQYLLKPLVDTINAQALRIQEAQRQYQEQMVTTYKGTLLSSIIRATMNKPQPPAELNNNRQKMAEYYIQHYFDNFPWEDIRIFNTPVVDTKVKEYTSIIIKQHNKEALKPHIIAALRDAKKNTEAFFLLFDKLEKILGDHASPYRVESIYIDMLKEMLNTPKLPELRKRHCNYELKAIDKNHEGEQAANFQMVLSTGDTTSLYDIESEYLILYLQHPTCPTCRKVRKMMANFPILNKAIATGRLKVLTVYFEDEADVWDTFIHSEEANPTYLHGWNFDQQISDKGLYDTRAIPYMFLLDKDKRIIRKNVMENDLEDQIKELNILY